MSDSLQPHGLQPTRLLRPWDFPGKSTGVATAFSKRKLSVDEFELGAWRRLLLLNCGGVGEDSCESLGLQDPANQSSWKFRISSEYSLEGLMLKLKLQYFGHLM